MHPTLSVDASASTQISATEATLNILISRQGNDPTVLIPLITQDQDQLTALLKTLMKQTDRLTDHGMASRQYQYEQTITYEQSIRYSLDTPANQQHLKQLSGQIQNALPHAQIHITWAQPDAKNLTQELLRQAYQDALNKANVLAEAANLHIHKLQSIELLNAPQARFLMATQSQDQSDIPQQSLDVRIHVVWTLA